MNQHNSGLLRNSRQFKFIVWIIRKVVSQNIIPFRHIVRHCKSCRSSVAVPLQVEVLAVNLSVPLVCSQHSADAAFYVVPKVPLEHRCVIQRKYKLIHYFFVFRLPAKFDCKSLRSGVINSGLFQQAHAIMCCAGGLGLRANGSRFVCKQSSFNCPPKLRCQFIYLNCRAVGSGAGIG